MKRLFDLTSKAAVLAVLVGIGWTGYVELSASEASLADESFVVVKHQTGALGASLADNQSFVADAGVEQITNLPALIKEWQPRYAHAQAAYSRFDSAIRYAEDRATTYLAAQEALTSRYNSEERRVQAEMSDRQDLALFQQWQERAHNIRAEAISIMERLADLDTDLRKLEMASEFSFGAGGFDKVPAEIAALNDELAAFQAASENIRSITLSPFDPARTSQ